MTEFKRRCRQTPIAGLGCEQGLSISCDGAHGCLMSAWHSVRKRFLETGRLYCRMAGHFFFFPSFFSLPFFFPSRLNSTEKSRELFQDCIIG